MSALAPHHFNGSTRLAEENALLRRENAALRQQLRRLGYTRLEAKAVLAPLQPADVQVRSQDALGPGAARSARVPSLANIADLPSRNEFELLKSLNARRCDVDLPPAGDWSAPLDVWFREERKVERCEA